MSADLLCEAAEKMRELADRASAAPWRAFEQHGRDITDEGWSVIGVQSGTRDVALTYPVRYEHDEHEADAAHIAAWHPDVARAVADWLDAVAAGWAWDDDEVTDLDGNPLTLAESVDSHALAVARAFLGRPQ